MVKLKCVKCNFEIEKDFIPRRCPYCAAEDTLESPKTPQDILDELRQ
jgi:predicted Zn-ribbon and HTH transcriptional regulator|tara:strand:- start:326 stop:466 length:141 start_codon:yes stop_codon:yes gene_type:complete